MLRFDHVMLRLQGYAVARWLGAATGCIWTLVLTALLLLAVLPSWLSSLDYLEHALLRTLAIVLIGIPLGLATLVALFLARTALSLPGALDLNEQGLTLVWEGKSRLVPHEDVRFGWYTAAEDEVVLTLGRGDVVRARGLGPAGASRLLDAIAAGATERALDLGLRREMTAARALAAALMIPAMIVVLSAVAALGSVPALMAVGAAFGVVWFVVISRFGAPDRVIVGHDGIALEGPQRARFISYERILEASPAVDGVALLLDDGSHTFLRLLKPRVGRALDLGLRRRDRLLSRIQAELAARKGSEAEPIGAALLDRQGRPLAAWRHALRELCAREDAGYRRASIDPEHLVRILEARDASTERRVGAALALSATPDAELRRRVRVVIDTCADEELRAAIEEAAEGAPDEQSFERALTRVSRV